MSLRIKWLLVLALLMCGLFCAGGLYWGLHQRYVPPEAIAVAKRFIALIEDGNFTEAYALTTQDAMSGRTQEQFESNVRHRIAQQVILQHPAVDWKGVRGGFQSYGNRLRRWLAGRKMDPYILSLEFTVGAPLEIRLISSPDGKWRVVYFQTHAA